MMIIIIGWNKVIITHRHTAGRIINVYQPSDLDIVCLDGSAYWRHRLWSVELVACNSFKLNVMHCTPVVSIVRRFFLSNSLFTLCLGLKRLAVRLLQCSQALACVTGHWRASFESAPQLVALAKLKLSNQKAVRPFARLLAGSPAPISLARPPRERLANQPVASGKTHFRSPAERPACWLREIN